MSAHLTPKENYLRVLHGEIPEWIPSYTQAPVPEGTLTPAGGGVEVRTG